MKHKLKITLILLSMFLVTQFLGLYVVHYYSLAGHALPFGLQSPQPQTASDYGSLFTGILFAFVFAILLFFFLTKFKISFVLKAWFFIVVVMALSIFFLAIIPKNLNYALTIALAIALVLAFEKIYRQNIVVHNLTELLVYPGIAAVFVPLLNVWTVVILLIVISLYDMWAVWHSGVMQKMAEYQIDNLKIFSGFFVPYASKGTKARIKKWKATLTKKQLSKKKVKVNLAILGGGDVVFPIIAAGVVLLSQGFFQALFVTFGATLGLSYLFFFAQKKKFYPAMPFISTGIFIGMILGHLIL